MDEGAAAELSPDTMIDLRRRAEAAAAAGARSFAIPEATPTAALLSQMAPTPALKDAAAGWLAAGAGYHDLVRLAGQTLLALEAIQPAAASVYVPKAAGELEPMLALWPGVLAIPTGAALTEATLIELRAFPVHPLGVVAAPAWADGRLCSPAEYFFHDLDHARYKVRRDLQLEGIEIPNPYRDGSTLDAATGRHRVVLPAAVGRIGSVLWRRADARRDFVRRLLRHAAGARCAPAAALLLFEIVHEKSEPLTEASVDAALATSEHVTKIERKWSAGFYGDAPPAAATVAALEEGRRWLSRWSESQS